MGDITKIDDSTIGKVLPITIKEIKQRIEDRNGAIAQYQDDIDKSTSSIQYLQSLNQEDLVLLKTAADIGVADAITKVANPVDAAADAQLTP